MSRSNAFGPVRANVDRDDLIRRARQGFARDPRVTEPKAGRCDGRVEIELAGVVGDLRGRTDVRDFEIAERQVRLGEGALKAFGELVGLAVAPGTNRLAHGAECGARARRGRVFRKSRPERVLVQLQELAPGAAEHHRAEPPVADRERLDPALSRGEVSKDAASRVHQVETSCHER